MEDSRCKRQNDANADLFKLQNKAENNRFQRENTRLINEDSQRKRADMLYEGRALEYKNNIRLLYSDASSTNVNNFYYVPTNFIDDGRTYSCKR